MPRLLVTLALLLAACGGGERAPVTVAAAASLREVMVELEAGYEKANPGLEVRTTFGGSGALRQQIEQGAPVDLFVSAAVAPMDALARAGRVDAATRRVFAGNELVLIVPARGGVVNGFADLAKPEVRRVALGAPASVPAGEYAVEALSAAGVLDVARAKAVYAQDVRQVLAFVSSGNADAGVVYRTDAAVTPRVRIAATAPAGSHRPIVYPAAVLADGPNAEGARAYLAFLMGPEGRAALRRRGFRVE
jgi:molybdate transport system substrate-binding protein